jgi:pimeloyl-ACP methyl ester carboxylesterase
MHGLGGFKEQPHIQTFADAFREKGYLAVLFDTTNTLGESAGNYKNATTTNYYEDLEDVIKWTKTQKWYQEPFILSGHSLGGFCTAFYAENYPNEVLALAPISTVVSGKLILEAFKRYEPEVFEKWEKTGWQIKESTSRPVTIKKLPWSFIADQMKFDLIPKAQNLTLPVLLIVGEKDTSTPADHVKILFEALPGQKEFHIIKGAPHTFRDPKHLEEIKQIFKKWIDSF